ncbi:MAG TPA: sialidase family protein [Acidimicrobiales bacterium]|nr:sialidase family protein [Acidimicrobiales bacterium]
MDANANQYSITASTINAGKTWARNTRFPGSLDGGVVSAACDQRYCFILADNAAVTHQALARTQDNGKTWTIVPYPRSWTKDSIDASIIACSSSRCLVYGDGTFATTPKASDQAAFVATSDDFRTWTDIALPGANQIHQLACIWSGQCWAEYETGGDGREHFATTLNGGATWALLGSVSPNDGGKNVFAFGFALDPDHQVGFACEDARTCFVLDNSDDLLTSHDGGRTWALSHGPSPNMTDAMTCTPGSTCWIVRTNPPRVWVGRPPG